MGEIAAPVLGVIPGPGFKALPEGEALMAAAGTPPMLQWLEISALRIDPRYQRPITPAGRRNVGAIAAGFCWSKFSPVIAAPIPGGLFSVIDGQHRCTAAALIGIKTVPAMVMLVDAGAQAAAFKAINGNVTKVSPLALHRAAVMEGDPEAVALTETCAAAGVRVVPYNTPLERLQTGETLALAVLKRAMTDPGPEGLITVLTCITATDDRPGVVSGPIVKALLQVIADRPAWGKARAALVAAVQEIDLIDERDRAMDRARMARRPASELLAGRLIQLLEQPMSGAESWGGE